MISNREETREGGPPVAAGTAAISGRLVSRAYLDTSTQACIR
jgi:hypothetical protein